VIAVARGIAIAIIAAAAGYGGHSAYTVVTSPTTPLPKEYRTLSDYQADFAFATAILIIATREIEPIGTHRVRFGECHRTPEQATINQMRGIGIANSTHRDRLACDLMLDRKIDGRWVYQTDSKQYKPLCAAWRSIGENTSPKLPLSCGIDFGDANHFSAEKGGVR
jgi:hypothetical protein